MIESKNPHSQPRTAQTAEPAAGAEWPAAAAGSDDAAGRQPTSPIDQDQASAVDQAISDSAASDVAANIDWPAQVRKLQTELAAVEDRVLRAHAELENYRKRASRFLEDEKKYAPLPLLRDLLPVLDNLERAIQSADQDAGAAGLLEGVKMVAQLLCMVLERHHCRRIEAQGAAFNPHLHEAVAQCPNEQLPPGTVVDVALTGYQLHERVVRPSQVLVSARPAAGPAVTTPASSGNDETLSSEA
jgi:molecular chaperone GrpE